MTLLDPDLVCRCLMTSSENVDDVTDWIRDFILIDYLFDLI